MLGLPYPGGPAVSRVALQGNRQAYRFPRPFLKDDDKIAFSFSGLKTAVRYAITGGATSEFVRPDLSEQQIADLAASFEEAVVDCLVGKAMLAVRQSRLSTLCVGGGVAANRRLRERLAAESGQANVRLHIAPPELCTDNAVMGAIAIERFRAGLTEDLDLDLIPGLVRQ